MHCDRALRHGRPHADPAARKNPRAPNLQRECGSVSSCQGLFSFRNHSSLEGLRERKHDRRRLNSDPSRSSEAGCAAAGAEIPEVGQVRAAEAEAHLPGQLEEFCDRAGCTLLGYARNGFSVQTITFPARLARNCALSQGAR